MKIIELALEQIIPYQRNPRNNKEAVGAVAKSIKRFGIQQPIVIDKDNVVICGHTRLMAAKKLALPTYPCVVAENLTSEEIKAYRLADNKTAELATWNLPLLTLELKDIKSINMEDFGFDVPDPDPVEDGFDLDQALDEITEPVTKPGQVFQLGAHRLMCGSATALADVQKLLGGRPADMVFTDPPYNIDYHGTAGTIQNDAMPDKEFYEFLYAFYDTAGAVLKPGGSIYVCHADSKSLIFRQAFVDAKLLLKQCLIWCKNTFTLGRQDFQWQHEPILYGWKPGAKHSWFGGRKQGTILEDNYPVVVSQDADGTKLININAGSKVLTLKVNDYAVVDTEDASTLIYVDKPRKNGDHPTMKPIALCARCIKNSSRHADAVLDLFGGSGSTLIACEELNRACYMMELDPKFCDVIIRRWEEFTGKKAQLIDY